MSQDGIILGFMKKKVKRENPNWTEGGSDSSLDRRAWKADERYSAVCKEPRHLELHGSSLGGLARTAAEASHTMGRRHHPTCGLCVWLGCQAPRGALLFRPQGTCPRGGTCGRTGPAVFAGARVASVELWGLSLGFKDGEAASQFWSSR